MVISSCSSSNKQDFAASPRVGMVDLPSFPPAFTPIVLRLSSSKEFQWLASCSFSIITCKLVYKITGFISHFCFKGYRKLSNEKKVEWNNRGFSTFHALIAALASLYLLFVSDLFHEDSSDELIVNRTSIISNTILGFSIGYFLSDLAMIFWHFPALGGLEYGFMLSGSICSSPLSLSGPAPWAIHVFDFSLPNKQSRADLHINGSLLREHNTFCKFEMVGTWMLLVRRALTFISTMALHCSLGGWYCLSCLKSWFFTIGLLLFCAFWAPCWLLDIN
ncbi:TRAM/LAG1/CLN8 homology domain - like 9 [Theobroma cacao]|nr:TRAM/LAG1/CLN8 homology domain - like 9 [Theobroma cacao]